MTYSIQQHDHNHCRFIEVRSCEAALLGTGVKQKRKSSKKLPSNTMSGTSGSG